MISPMKSTPWSLLPAIMVNSTTVFFTSATFVCGFWNNLFYFKSTRETCAHVYFFPFLSSKHLNALAMRIMYHKTDQTSFLYGLSRPSLGRRDSMPRLKLFLKKVGLSQPSFSAYRYIRSENNKKKLLLLLDCDGDSCIKNPVANDNRTFGLVSDDDYPNSRCLTGKCTFLTTYYNNNSNNYNSENNVDNNSNDNDHDFSFLDYYNSSVLTGSKPYTATERNAKNDTLVNSNKNKKSENNVDNNSYSNNNNNSTCCANSEDNNDNIIDGNFISASTPPPSDSNVDNAPPGRNNTNNVMRSNSNNSDRDRDSEQRSADSGRNKRLPSFISHPNGILLRVFKKQRSRIEKDQRRPSFICHPNGIVLKVLNQKLRRSTSSLSSAMEMETKMEKTKTKTDQNGAKQRVRQLNCAKQRANQHHYSHAHHRPPQQQYKSKSWTIAIILKLTFVAWDSWTYRIGF